MSMTPDPDLPGQSVDAVENAAEGGAALGTGAADTHMAEHPVGGDSPLDPTKGATPPTEQR